jgi:WD40 repeat protein
MRFRFRALSFIVRSVLCCWLLLTAGSALLPAQTACPAPAGWVKPVSGDLFSDEQEIWLGDAMADLIENEYTIVKDPAENAYLEKIGARLLAVLPPTKIRFRFVLIDSREVNGFSLAGGRVYLTRKLVASARSEDEVAGVLAHEIGHIITHQSAAEISDQMRRLMGVTSIGDKADVYDKFRRLMDAERNDKKHHEDSDSDPSQNQADRVAVYAIAVAGYQPQAYAEFWDRSFFVQGKTGGAVSDFFGLTKPTQKRLRQLRQLVAELPKGCGAATASETAEFHQWQNAVTANQKSAAATETAAEKTLELKQPLRMDLQRVRFSRDGKYLFAQDESSIFVLQHDPLKFLFRLDADEAKPAEWSPDSTKIVFYTPKLHVEEWSVAQQKLLSAHEIVVKNECVQTALSPDGRTLACVMAGEPVNMTGPVPFNLSLIDTESGQSIYQKNNFVSASVFTVWAWALRHEVGLADDPFFSAISQDGNYLVIGVDSGKLAFDLRSRTPIKLGGDFDHYASGAFAFEEQAIVGENMTSPKDSGWFSFPDGKRLGKVAMNLTTLNSVSKGDYLVGRGGEHNNTFILNIAEQKGLELPHVHTLDMWGSSIAMEALDGSVAMGTFDGVKPIQVSGNQALPLSPLGSTRIVELSPDGRYLAISGKSRGGVWDLTSGERLYHVRGFTGITFHPDGNVYIDFPKYDKIERTVMQASLSKNAMTKVDYAVSDAMFLRASRMMEWKDQGKGRFLLTVRDLATGNEQWNRTFDKEKPASTKNFADDNLLFVWTTSSPGAKSELKSKPELAAQVAALKDKDAGLLIEIVSIDKGETLRSVVLARPPAYDGVYGLDQVQDTILVDTSDNRVLLFSAKTGEMTHQVFGYVVGVDRQAGLFCVKNRRDEALVYDMNGNEISHFQAGTTVRFAKFKDDGKKLLLLGADQKIREIKLPGKTVDAPAHSDASSAVTVH